MKLFTCVFTLLLACSFSTMAQTAQVGAQIDARSTDRLRLDYLHYRPAEWEKDLVEELENKPENEGGLVYLYLTNTSDEKINLRYWRINDNDESYWRLNHYVAWDRMYDENLDPGQQTVLEINAITKDFGPGSPFDFSFIDSSWAPVLRASSSLVEDPVQISYIRVLPGMQEVEVHIRNEGDTALPLSSLEIAGREVAEVDWVSTELPARGTSIGRATLAQPLPAASLLIVKAGVGDRQVYAHRRAFEDYFPIGTWSGNEETYALLRRLHIDTIVEGGTSTNNFYSNLLPKYGFRTMVHTGSHVNVDVLRDLGDHPAVACWMIQDEPDWSIPANIMLHADETTRQYNSTKPTFITLCRNIKFFEYAPIADIPCQDHYAVTAPSSSKWPKFYGTRLEETAWYTRDLKLASEPKPIWIWTQAIANWDERPKRPVPTPEELAAQLVLNLGRGAKGILWFNYDHEVAEKFPEVRDAMRLWGRVMRVLRGDLLGAEPLVQPVEAPDKVDAVALASRDAVVVCLTNTDYEIHPEAYPFTMKEDVTVTVPLPQWLPEVTAVAVTTEGVQNLPVTISDGKATIEVGNLEVCRMIALVKDPAQVEAYKAEFEQAVDDEDKTFD
jgi:hypothetical protein